MNTRMEGDHMILFQANHERDQYKGLLDQMVKAHLAEHGELTGAEFMQIFNAVTLWQVFGPHTCLEKPPL